MHVYLKNLVYVILCLIMLEVCLYFKDYNSVLIYENYIRYDIVNSDLESFKLNEYEIIVEDNEYTIIYDRKPIFNFKFLKKIVYHGII